MHTLSTSLSLLCFLFQFSFSKTLNYKCTFYLKVKYAHKNVSLTCLSSQGSSVNTPQSQVVCVHKDKH